MANGGEILVFHGPVLGNRSTHRLGDVLLAGDREETGVCIVAEDLKQLQIADVERLEVLQNPMESRGFR